MKLSDLASTNRFSRTFLPHLLDPFTSAVPDGRSQAHVVRQPRSSSSSPAEKKLPPNGAVGLDRPGQAMRTPTEPNDPAFLEGIVASLPSLRPFAVSLTRSVEQAEDLVQETVLKAISKQEQFEAGTNLQAWLFAIMRNLFCSVYRRTRHEVEDADGSYAATMISIPDHEDRIMLKDLAAALAKLPQGQREAIVLVGVKGMTYEEAAQALECAVGTIQSRVNRARNRLAELMGLGRAERHCHGASKAKNVFC